MRGMVATIAANMALASFDPDKEDRWRSRLEEFRNNFKNMRWADVDVTPVYNSITRLLGYAGVQLPADDRRRYFSILGHFKDPMKWAMKPLTSAHHKGSPLYRMFHEAMAGTDWKGDSFTSYDEWLGIDEKGYYKTSGPGHRVGDPKGGQLKMSLTKRGGETGAINYERMPSWLGHQAISAMPIQIQEIVGFASGINDKSVEQFVDSFGRAAGVRVSRGGATPYQSAAKEINKFDEQLEEFRLARDTKGAAVLRRDNPRMVRASRRLDQIEKRIRTWNRALKTYEKSEKLSKSAKKEKMKTMEDRIRQAEQEFVAYYREAR
jgi:hypothetical protein